jgi:hypothetical protein
MFDYAVRPGGLLDDWRLHRELGTSNAHACLHGSRLNLLRLQRLGTLAANWASVNVRFRPPFGRRLFAPGGPIQIFNARVPQIRVIPLLRQREWTVWGLWLRINRGHIVYGDARGADYPLT